MTDTNTASGAADLRDTLINIAREIEALKRECGMDPESPIAIQNGRYMALSYKVRALAAGQATAAQQGVAYAELPDALEVQQLKSCPCGATPTALQITGDEQAKWAHVSGNCCGEWEIEYRNNYTKLASTEAMTLAAAAWNEAPRASHGQAPAVDWSQVGLLLDAHATTRQFLTGTTNWAAAICRYMTKHAAQAAPAAVAGQSEAVAYLDIGAGGYLDLGTDLTDEALSRLPKGRHALVIAGTYGIDGYIAAPTTQPAPQQEAQEPVAWQSRTRPTWGGNDRPWSPWESCTKGLAEDCWKTPLLHDWAYEARALYTAPQPSPAAQGDALDAARYRWLRINAIGAYRTNDGKGPVSVYHLSKIPAIPGIPEETDAAIDTACAAQEGKTHE